MSFLNVYVGFLVAMTIVFIAINKYLKRQRHLCLFVTVVAVSVPMNATIIKYFMYNLLSSTEESAIIVVKSTLVYLLLLMVEEIIMSIIGKNIWKRQNENTTK